MEFLLIMMQTNIQDLKQDGACDCSVEAKNFILDTSITDFVNVTLNGKPVKAPKGITVIQLCEIEGVEIPRFCYHDRLKIAGNCRMCLVEIQPGPPKPQASCAMNVAEGMIINTETDMVKKAREGVMEFLLQNHPLDCPICDQGGECDLQDQAFLYGRGESRFSDDKRAVVDKNMGPLVKTQMTRCIHCMRCVRFIDDIAGTNEIGAFNRGQDVEVTTYLNTAIKSELSGNIIDLCPVGALTSKPYRFRARSWELKKTYSIDVLDAVGSNIRIDSKGNEVLRILPALNESINEEWISDKTRFAYDGLKLQRLGHYYEKRDGKFVKTDKSSAMDFIKHSIASMQNPKEQIAFIAGDLADCESVLAFKKLAEELEVEKFTCLQDGSKINTSSRANYICNNGIDCIEQSDAILIIGSNPRLEAPLFNARIRKAFLNNKAKIYLLGEKCDLNYNFTHLGSDRSILDDILEGKNAVCDILKNAKRPCIILGQDAINDTHGIEIHNKCLEIASLYTQREGWNGFNMLHKAAGRVGGLDLEFTSKYSLYDIIQQAINGEVKVLFLLGADEINFESLKASPNLKIIYLGSHGDRGAGNADVILPTRAYTEKSAHYVNTAGHLQSTFKAVAGVEEALDDKDAIVEIAKTLNLKAINAHLLTKEVKEVVEQKSEQKELSFNRSQVKLSGEFRLTNKDFYQTCYISRASKTMAICKAG